MNSVYLMVEVELSDIPVFTQKHRENAKRDVDNLIMQGMLSHRAYKSENAVFKHAVILPDDMPEVLKREKYRDLPSHERLKQLVIENGKRPAKERWQELIDRGAINEKGEVLLKGPYPMGEEE